MLEIIGRVLFGVVAALILVPVMCVAAAPYILIRGFFRSGGYWKNVRAGFKGIIKRTLDFGPDFLQP